MKKIILLIVILIVTDFTLVSKKSNIKNSQKENWEYVKNRLYSGKGDTEYVYKINALVKDAPILISLHSASEQDSLIVNEIIDELKVIIPNKKIDFFKNFAGKSFYNLEQTLSGKEDETLINGFSFYELRFSNIEFSFEKSNNTTVFDDLIETRLPDGSIIERINPPRNETYIELPNKVWLRLKETLSKDERKKYIKYELLRTLCYIYPNQSHSRYNYVKKGVFYAPNYMPDKTEFNNQDIFLLQRLYSNNFLKQFKSYLYTTYSWRYATTFLNKKLATLYAILIVGSIGILVFILLFGIFQNKIFKFSFFNYFLPILCVWIYYSNLSFIYRYLTDFNDPIDWEDTIIFGLIVVSVIALITSFLLWGLEKLFVKENSVFSLKLILKTVLTFLAFSIPIALIFIFDGHINEGINFFFPSFLIFVALALGRGLLIYLNHFSDSLVKEKEVELSHLKEINALAETKLLQSQINPHFLYNALNSIASLAPVDSQKTQKMAHSLSDLFKYSINRKGENMSTIKDEIEMVKTYLEIEKIRFGDRLQFTVEVDKDLENKEIPLFLVQPLIENAVKHGISKNVSEGKIILKIKKKEGDISISVSDNGPSFPEGLVSGHGLQTVYDLLRLSYKDKASLNWTNTPEKMISITIHENI